MLLTALFLIIVIIMLLNTLIAMMAQTFAAVSRDAFCNYAFAFGKTLVYLRNSSGIPVPLNLLSLPYHFVSFLISCRRNFKTLSEAHKNTPSSAAEPEAATAAESPGTTAPPPVIGEEHDLKADGSGRDPEVIKRIDDIRLLILSDPAKQRHFERSLTYFCQVQVPRRTRLRLAYTRPPAPRGTRRPYNPRAHHPSL